MSNYYQSGKFNRKLQQARNYKRTVRQPGDRKGGPKFSWQKVLLIAAVAVLVYLIYIPNFLYVRTVSFQGLSDSDATKAKQDVDKYFREASFIWPQKNMLLLEKGKLNDFLTRPDGVLYQISSIKRSFFHRELVIKASVKQPSFVLITKNSSYVMNNDGSVAAEILAGQTVPRLLNIRNPQAELLHINQRYFSASLLDELAKINSSLPGATKAEIESYEIPETGDAPIPTSTPGTSLTTNSNGEALLPPGPSYEEKELDPPAIIVRLKKTGSQPKGAVNNYNVYLDAHSDLEHVFKQLQYLLSQLSPERYNKLYYIDLRIQDKSFICLINTPCVQEQPAVLFNTSPTNSNNLNSNK